MVKQTSCMLRLRLEDTGRELTFHKERILIGRNADCDLPFPGSATISRNQAVIFYRDGICSICSGARTPPPPNG